MTLALSHQTTRTKRTPDPSRDWASSLLLAMRAPRKALKRDLKKSGTDSSSGQDTTFPTVKHPSTIRSRHFSPKRNPPAHRSENTHPSLALLADVSSLQVGQSLTDFPDFARFAKPPTKSMLIKPIESKSLATTSIGRVWWEMRG